MFRQHVDAPGGSAGQDLLEPLSGIPEPGHGVAGDLAAAAAGGRLHGRSRQFGGRDRRHPVDQVMRLVDDHHIVLRQDLAILQRVDGEQRVIGDDEVGPAGGVAGPLGKAARAERAALSPDALPRGDRDLPPGALIHSRHELVTVAARGRLRPLPHPLHLPPDLRGGASVEQRLLGLVGRAVSQPVAAQVVAAPLEDRERRGPAEQRLQRPDKTRQVSVDELALQGDRGR